MSKRTSFILAALALAAGLVLVDYVSRDQQLLTIFIYTVLVYAASAFALRFVLRGVRLLTLPALPTLFAMGIAFTQFYFPNLTLGFKSVLWAIAFVGLYIIFLMENIFSVALERGTKIPLYRAAKTTAFLATIVVAFLHLTAVYKSNLPFWAQIALVTVLVLVLSFQLFWVFDLTQDFERKMLAASLLVALGVGEVALSLSFWPLESFFRAVVLATALYIGLGIGQQYFEHRLTRRIVYEYGLTAALVGLVLSIL
jgi:hypothetical protein